MPLWDVEKMDGDSPPPAKRQKGAACVHCRQMKVISAWKDGVHGYER